MQLVLRIVLAGVMCAIASPALAQMRFQGMDKNKDGVVTRAEWRGNDTAFRNQDWNQDGILSGEEVRAGGRRQHNWNQDWNRDGRVDTLDTHISERYRGYDMNGDNRVARSEWAGDARVFTRLDTNRDRYLSMEEYAQGGGFTLDAQGGPPSRPTNDDRNNDDRNNDGWVTRSEWNMNPTNAAGEFDRLDANRDNRISRYELDTVATASKPEVNHSAAWRTGYDRGISEGRAAGREDQTRRQGWDLEGQRELERADSGYTFQVGTLSDYQAGYREGFRNAYRAGFVQAGGRAPQ